MTDQAVEDFLAHYGVKGMQWGVRKSDYPGASRRTNREASKDAREFARAKMFYGEGAGTRRKLINATVQAKSKKDPTYAKAFDHHLKQQDLSTHASKARKERRRTDTRKGAVKTVKGAHRSLTGGFGSVSLAAAILAGGYSAAKNSGVDQTIARTMKSTMNNARQGYKRRNVENFLRKSGLGNL